MPGIDVAAYPAFISLCTGGGGLDAGLGLAVPGASAVCYVEREATEAGVLAKSIESGWVADAPIWSDLFTFDARAWRGLVDGVVGGFPCQPHSYAGKRLGEADDRNLWPVVARLVHDAAPSWCFFENVPGILDFYGRVIRPDLESLGYTVAEGIFSAEEVGASHLRERLFWLAYRDDARGWSDPPKLTGRTAAELSGERPQLAHGSGVQPRPRGEQPAGTGETRSGCEELADTEHGLVQEQGRRKEGRAGPRPDGPLMGDAESLGAQGNGRCGDGLTCPSTEQGLSGRSGAFPPGPAGDWAGWLNEWPGTEPAVRRDADGLAFRGDRLRVLGNGVVPLAAAHALLSLQARLEVTL